MREELRRLEEEKESYRTRFIESVNAFNDMQMDYVDLQTTVNENAEQETQMRNDLLERLEGMESLRQDLEEVRSERDRNGQRLAAVRLQLEQTTASNQTEITRLQEEKDELRDEKEAELRRLQDEHRDEINRVREELQEERESERDRIIAEKDQELADIKEQMANVEAHNESLTAAVEEHQLARDNEIATLRLDNEHLRRSVQEGTERTAEEYRARIQDLEARLSDCQRYLAETDIDSDDDDGRHKTPSWII